MAADKLVDSTQLNSDLTSVADAIRAKGGTSAQLEFPDEFVSAVQAIPTGITPTGTKQISITENGTVTEDVTNYASAEITVNVSGGASMEDELVTGNFTSYTNDRVTSIRSQFFSRMTYLQSVSFANVTSLPGERHFDRTGISSLSMPKLAGTSSYMCNECQSLLNIPATTFPLVTSIGPYSFCNCQHLETADFPSVTQIAANAFSRCFLLTDLVLRADSVCSLANVSAFENTPIRGRNSMNGTIYVPSSLIESYKTATNWSTIFNEGHLTFAAIEGSAYDT